jgi:uncharacterized protein YprB with RNaseH-like and TPR domain
MKYQKWHQEVIKKSEAGLSGRKIAKETGLAKSTINDMLKEHREGTLEYSEPKLKKPKILYFDLETSLMQVYTFGIWNVNIAGNRITKHSHILSNSWAYDDEEVQGIRLTPEQVKNSDDLMVVVDTIKAIEGADILVSYNGVKFDRKVLNTRALHHGLPPIRWCKQFDVMVEVKKNFRFPSNSMENVSRYLGLDGKVTTSGNRLWERCFEWWNHEECDKALADMLYYGKHDITVTRNLYKRIKGWDKSAVNVGLITKEINGVNTKDNHELLCCHCGSNDVDNIGSKAYTSVSSFDIYRCGNSVCRGLNRSNAAGTKLVNYI